MTAELRIQLSSKVEMKKKKKAHSWSDKWSLERKNVDNIPLSGRVLKFDN